MVLYSRYGNGFPTDTKFNNSYSVDRARLIGVILKIVDSISLNVINPGHILADLPEEL